MIAFVMFIVGGSRIGVGVCVGVVGIGIMCDCVGFWRHSSNNGREDDMIVQCLGLYGPFLLLW